MQYAEQDASVALGCLILSAPYIIAALVAVAVAVDARKVGLSAAGWGFGSFILPVFVPIAYVIVRRNKVRQQHLSAESARTLAAQRAQQKMQYEVELAGYKEMEIGTVVSAAQRYRDEIAACGGVEGALLIERDKVCEQMQSNIESIHSWLSRLRAAWDADDQEEIDQCGLGLARMVGWTGATLWALREIDGMLGNKYARDTAAFERRWRGIAGDVIGGPPVYEVGREAAARLAAEGITLPVW